MTQANWLKAASAALLVTGTLACADQHAVADETITTQVKKAIAQHPDLGPPNQIYVDTRDHTVYLTGAVDNGLTIANAQDVARKIPGVSDVVSNLYVSGKGD